MSPRMVRDEVLHAWAGILARAGVPWSETNSVALELEKAMEGRGVPLPRTVRREEPDAHWADRPEGTNPAPTYRVARRELRLARSQLTSEDFQVLKAAAAGNLEVRHDPGAALEVWVARDGHNLTSSAAALEARGLLDRCVPDEAGRVAARLTEPGRRIWDDLGELATAAADGGE